MERNIPRHASVRVVRDEILTGQLALQNVPVRVNVCNFHSYPVAIIPYQSSNGSRCKLSDVVWVVYEYRDAGMIVAVAEDDWGRWRRCRWKRRGGTSGRLSTLCPWQACIQTESMYRRSSRRRDSRDTLMHGIEPVWRYNSNANTPLTSTATADITFIHVILHRFFETKGTGEKCTRRRRGHGTC